MNDNLELARMEAEIAFKEKDVLIAYLAWFFLGTLGVHRFYLGRIKTGVAMILLLLTSFLILPGIALLIWWFLDAYFVYQYVEENNLEMKKKQLEHLKDVADNQIVE